MATVSQPATLSDLYRTTAKAELIGGRIVEYLATGFWPNEVAGNIYVSLKFFSRKSGRGKAFTNNLGYAVPELPSGRESFSPDASYYDVDPIAETIDCYRADAPDEPVRFVRGQMADA